jgi:Kdo2-lipid IVA lauroyltransferase/acyltransferase
MKLKHLRSFQWLEYAAARLGTLPFAVLPPRMASRVGEGLGMGLYYTLKRRRAIGLKNLDIAFGTSLSAEQKQQILQATFRNLGKMLAEEFLFPTIDQAYLKNKVAIVGLDHYLNARRKGRGVIFLSAHFGNWELIGPPLALNGYPFNVVVRPLDNYYLDRFVFRFRTLHGNTMIDRGGGLKHIIAALKRKETVGIIVDQNTLRSKGIFVNFFGKLACTTPVVALLALRYDVPVIPIFMIRTGFDTHRLEIGAEAEILRSGDMDRDIAVNTERFNQIIETFIRQYPDQWFWVHNRWKTRPESEMAH